MYKRSCKANLDLWNIWWSKRTSDISDNQDKAPFRYDSHVFCCDCCVPKFRGNMFISCRPYTRLAFDMWDDYKYKTINENKKWSYYNRKEGFEL